MKTKKYGFTLIELLIALAIVGILAAIAYPSYKEDVNKSKRADAQAALVSFANAMEMWRMNNGANGYKGAAAAGADTGSPTMFSAVVPVSGGVKTYDLKITAATATTYTLTADPVDSSESDITLQQNGVKSW